MGKMGRRSICYICDELCIERFYENLLRSQTYTDNIRKRQQFK